MEILRGNPELAGSIVLNMAVCAILAVLSSALTALYIDRDYGLTLMGWTLAAVIVMSLIFLLNPGLIRRKSERSIRKSLGLSNLLTTLRIVATVPILVSFLEGYITAAFIIYVIAALTDVLDGIIARRYSQITVIGIMIDPVGDILNTEAVFFWLWRAGEVPGWLLVILTVRYIEFFLGWIFLFVTGRELPLSATLAGKSVGVIQFSGIIIMLFDMVSKQFEIAGPARDIMMYILGISFITVIISQTVIGWNAFRIEPGHSVTSEEL